VKACDVHGRGGGVRCKDEDASEMSPRKLSFTFQPPLLKHGLIIAYRQNKEWETEDMGGRGALTHGSHVLDPRQPLAWIGACLDSFARGIYHCTSLETIKF
jgi:hypothetical protein